MEKDIYVSIQYLGTTVAVNLAMKEPAAQYNYLKVRKLLLLKYSKVILGRLVV